MTFTLITVNALVFIIWQAPDYYRAQSVYELQGYIDQIWMYRLPGVFMREGQGIGAFTLHQHVHARGFLPPVRQHDLSVDVRAAGRGRLRPWRFLLFYLTSGMIANLGSEVLNPGHLDIPSIGASGAIAGVMGAYLILFPSAKVDLSVDRRLDPADSLRRHHRQANLEVDGQAARLDFAGLFRRAGGAALAASHPAATAASASIIWRT